MAATNFEWALERVFAEEGGFVDDPRDPGRATKFGITRATLARSRGRPVSVAEVRALERAEAAAIYRRDYWQAVSGDALSAGLDLAVFDFAVNAGPVRAARTLQAVLGCAPDGRIGPVTLAAAAGRPAASTIRALGRARLDFLRSLPTWPRFGRGWSARVGRVERAALTRAAAQPPAPHPAARLSGDHAMSSTMSDIKPVLASRTVWANAIGLAATLLALLGVDPGGIDPDGLATALSQVVAGASFIASTIFRIAATKRLGAA